VGPKRSTSSLLVKNSGVRRRWGTLKETVKLQLDKAAETVTLRMGGGKNVKKLRVQVKKRGFRTNARVKKKKTGRRKKERFCIYSIVNLLTWYLIAKLFCQREKKGKANRGGCGTSG